MIRTILVYSILLAWQTSTSAAPVSDEQSVCVDIISRIDDASSPDRREALEAADDLEFILQELHSARPRFEEMLASPKLVSRLVGVKVLWGLDGVASPQHLPILVACLKHKSMEVRRTSIRLIGKLAEGASPAVDSLRSMLNNDDPDTRILTAFALGRIGSAAGEASTELSELLKDGEFGSWGAVGAQNTVRNATSHALRQIGAGVLPSVEPYLESNDPAIRAAAINVLAGGGQATQQFTPLLTSALKDDSRHIRLSALKVLFELNFRSKSTLPAMVEMLFDEDATIAQYCLQQLEKTPEHLGVVVHRLADLLADDSAYRRASAAQLLGEVGSDARPVLHKLRQLAGDERNIAFYEKFNHPTVGALVVEAIRRIETSK